MRVKNSKKNTYLSGVKAGDNVPRDAVGLEARELPWCRHWCIVKLQLLLQGHGKSLTCGGVKVMGPEEQLTSASCTGIL